MALGVQGFRTSAVHLACHGRTAAISFTGASPSGTVSVGIRQRIPDSGAIFWQPAAMVPEVGLFSPPGRCRCVLFRHCRGRVQHDLFLGPGKN